jgi:hypothetical protein
VTKRHQRLAMLFGACALAAIWLLSGVRFDEMVRFAAFEALYVLLPGCVLFVALSPASDGWLRTIAIGWPLGYAIEIGAFALTAALHVRGLLTLLPLGALAALGLLMLHPGGRERLRALNPATERGTKDPSRPGRSLDWLPVVGAFTAAMVVLAFTFYASSPLPANARSVVYSGDNVFDVTIAGEARHHWPITESWVADQPLRYYTGIFMHAAALNQVAGVTLSTSFFRLLPGIMFLIAALQLWALGRCVGRSRWIGPLAAALLLVAQDINLDPTRSQVFHINPFTQFPLSPTFALGVPFFLGALLLIQSRYVLRSGDWGALLMLGVLVLGMTAAKAFAAFDFVAALGLYWLWCVARKRPSRGLMYCVGVSGLAALAIYFLLIAGGGAGTLGLRPLNFIHEGDTLARATKLAKDIVGPSLYWAALGAGGAILAVCLLAPLLGASWLIWKDRGATDSTALLLTVFMVGVASYLLLGAPGGVEGVFLIYGYIALLPLAAKGLVYLWDDTPAQLRRSLALACGALLALGLAIALLTPALSPTGSAKYAWFVLAYGSVAGVIVLTVWRLYRRYGASIPSRTARIAACCIPLVSALALVKPLALAGTGAWKTVAGEPTSARDSAGAYGMTAPLYRGLLWVRAHTNPCDVLAVSNHYEHVGKRGSVYFYYSAFTERRVFLESWNYTPGGLFGGQPFPARFALNNLAVQRGDPTALHELARRGVSYVLVDKTHGGGALEPPSVSRLVFSNSALNVYRLLDVGRAPYGCATVS